MLILHGLASQVRTCLFQNYKSQAKKPSIWCILQGPMRGEQRLPSQVLLQLRARHPPSGQMTASCLERVLTCLAAILGRPRHLVGEVRRAVLGAMAVIRCGSGRGTPTSGTVMGPSQKIEITRPGSRSRPKGPAWLVGRFLTPAGTSRRAARVKQAGSPGMTGTLAAHSLIAAGTTRSYQSLTSRCKECCHWQSRRLGSCSCTIMLCCVLASVLSNLPHKWELRQECFETFSAHLQDLKCSWQPLVDGTGNYHCMQSQLRSS